MYIWKSFISINTKTPIVIRHNVRNVKITIYNNSNKIQDFPKNFSHKIYKLYI